MNESTKRVYRKEIILVIVAGILLFYLAGYIFQEKTAHIGLEFRPVNYQYSDFQALEKKGTIQQNIVKKAKFISRDRDFKVVNNIRFVDVTKGFLQLKKKVDMLEQGEILDTYVDAVAQVEDTKQKVRIPIRVYRNGKGIVYEEKHGKIILTKNQDVFQQHQEINETYYTENSQRRTGYVFGGWYYRNQSGQEILFDFSKGLYQNYNLYAKWYPTTSVEGKTRKRIDEHTRTIRKRLLKSETIELNNRTSKVQVSKGDNKKSTSRIVRTLKRTYFSVTIILLIILTISLVRDGLILQKCRRKVAERREEYYRSMEEKK